MNRRSPRLLAAAVAVLATAGVAQIPGPSPLTATAASNGVAAQAPAATIVAVGDIACPPAAAVTATRCRQAATARLARSLQPRYVLALGDNQYDSGSLAAYRGSYAKSWGALKSITKPVPGNHEYRTRGATGYHSYYYGRRAWSRAYYAFNVGKWRIYSLDSNCDRINCGPQAEWLKRDMNANPRRCTLLTMHHPRYSSGEHGSSTISRPFWRVAYAHHADIILSGHDHDYERFHRMNAEGRQTTAGPQSFVVGTGGKSLYQYGTIAPGSAFRNNTVPGVLKLTLQDTKYSYAYHTIDGRVIDKGGRECR